MHDTKQLLREARDRVAPPTDVVRSLERRRARDAQRKRVAAAVVGIAVALVGLGGWLAVQRDLPPQVADRVPTGGSQRLGIFAPFAGRIVYPSFDGQDIWGIDPEATDQTPVRLVGVVGIPVGWSSDGTELLLIRTQRGVRDGGLIVWHADGTKTSLGPITSRAEGWLTAAISPDGSRVAYTALADGGGSSMLSVVDVDTGDTTVLVEAPGMGSLYQPTFSPDGTQIAYIEGGGDHSHHVWVVNSDGSDPHMIVDNAMTSGIGHVEGLAWSPSGDRIALGLSMRTADIYTFTPDGERFTLLIPDALFPSWSPEGTQVAFIRVVMRPCPEDPDNCRSFDDTGGLGIADGDGSDAHTFGVGAWADRTGPWHPA